MSKIYNSHSEGNPSYPVYRPQTDGYDARKADLRHATHLSEAVDSSSHCLDRKLDLLVIIKTS